MKLLAIIALSLFATLANADTVTVPLPSSVQLTVPTGCTLSGSQLSCPPSGTIPTCPSPPGAGPCGPTIPTCPSPPGAGPCGGPVDPGAISCKEVSGRTIVLNIDWNNPKRMATADFGHMSPTDAVVAVFKTGNVTSPTNNLPRIAASEFSTTNPSTRIAVLSPKPCDWSAQPTTGASSSGTSVTIPFTVNNPVNYGFYPILELNTVYYMNIKNDPNAGCFLVGVCDIAVDLTPVRATAGARIAAQSATNANDQALAKAWGKLNKAAPAKKANAKAAK